MKRFTHPSWVVLRTTVALRRPWVAALVTVSAIALWLAVDSGSARHLESPWGWFAVFGYAALVGWIAGSADPVRRPSPIVRLPISWRDTYRVGSAMTLVFFLVPMFAVFVHGGARPLSTLAGLAGSTGLALLGHAAAALRRSESEKVTSERQSRRGAIFTDMLLLVLATIAIGSSPADAQGGAWLGLVTSLGLAGLAAWRARMIYRSCRAQRPLALLSDSFVWAVLIAFVLSDFLHVVPLAVVVLWTADWWLVVRNIHLGDKVDRWLTIPGWVLLACWFVYRSIGIPQDIQEGFDQLFRVLPRGSGGAFFTWLVVFFGCLAWAEFRRSRVDHRWRRQESLLRRLPIRRHDAVRRRLSKPNQRSGLIVGFAFTVLSLVLASRSDGLIPIVGFGLLILVANEMVAAGLRRAGCDERVSRVLRWTIVVLVCASMWFRHVWLAAISMASAITVIWVLLVNAKPSRRSRRRLEDPIIQTWN